MLKKSLLLTSCLMVGVVLSSGSFAMNKENEVRDQGKSVSRKAVKSKNVELPKDKKQPSLLKWFNPYRHWVLQMNAEVEAFEQANKIAYAKQKKQEREDAEM
jgi:hypothetical protein